MLVLRGVADVRMGKWGTRKYVLAKDTSMVIPQMSAQLVGDLLADCRQSRPEIWELLDKEIEKAVKRRTHQCRGKHDGFQEADPWLAESAADQERLTVHAKPVMAPNWFTIPLGIGLALFVRWLATRTDLDAFAAVTAAVLTIALGLFSLPFQQLRNIEKRISTWFRAGVPVPKGVPDPTTYTLVDRIAGLLVGVSLLTGLVVIARAYIPEHPGTLLILAGGAGYGLYLLFRKKAAEAINTRVTGGGVLPTQPPIAETYQEATTSPVSISADLHSVEPGVAETMTPTEPESGTAAGPAAIPRTDQPPVRRPPPIALEVVTADALPPVSEESRRRVGASGSAGLRFAAPIARASSGSPDRPRCWRSSTG